MLICIKFSLLDNIVYTNFIANDIIMLFEQNFGTDFKYGIDFDIVQIFK